MKNSKTSARSIAEIVTNIYVSDLRSALQEFLYLMFKYIAYRFLKNRRNRQEKIKIIEK
jgi:hypothetical protein